MEIERCIAGKYILATSKKRNTGRAFTYDNFLKMSPLGIGIIQYVSHLAHEIVHVNPLPFKYRHFSFSFSPEELIELKSFTEMKYEHDS